MKVNDYQIPISPSESFIRHANVGSLFVTGIQFGRVLCYQTHELHRMPIGLTVTAVKLGPGWSVTI